MICFKSGKSFIELQREVLIVQYYQKRACDTGTSDQCLSREKLCLRHFKKLLWFQHAYLPIAMNEPKAALILSY